MAAMPFPYNGILVVLDNLLKIFPMSTFYLPQQVIGKIGRGGRVVKIFCKLPPINALVP